MVFSAWPGRPLELGEADLAAGAELSESGVSFPRAPASKQTVDATISQQTIDAGEPVSEPSDAQDAVMQSIARRVDEFQAELASTRTQVRQLAGEKAASTDAMIASQALAAERGKTIEQMREQEAALRAELADLKREAARSTEAARQAPSDPPSVSARTDRADGIVPAAQTMSEHRAYDLPAGARTRVNVTFAIGREAARSKALALTATLAKSGIRATEPMGVESTTPGVHVTYSYRQDRPTANEITKNLLVPDPTWSHRAQNQSVRPGAIELFVGS